MRDNDDQNTYLPHRNSDKDRRIVEIPIESRMPYPDRLPSGYDPVQSIGLEGRAFRGLSGGIIPWWILITGCVIFGGFALLTLGLAISSGFLSNLPLLLLNSLPIIILWRGTAAKISVQGIKNKKR